jgi:hypothetical protein
MMVNLGSVEVNLSPAFVKPLISDSLTGVNLSVDEEDFWVPETLGSLK